MPSWSTSSDRERGFTLVEILVVVPIVILVVAVLIGFLVTLTGDALVSRERAEIVYSSQDALNQIEQDIRLTKSFRSSSGALPSPQGSNSNFNGTAAFTSSNNHLVMEQYATTNQPTYSNRDLVYYEGEPNPCGPQQQYNDTLETMVIYFVDNGDLRRRTIVEPDGNLCGGAIWQKNSCKVSAYSYARCDVADTILATDVSQFTIQYYTRADLSIPPAIIDDSVMTADVTLTITKTVAGENVSHTAVMRADKLNFGVGVGSPHI